MRISTSAAIVASKSIFFIMNHSAFIQLSLYFLVYFDYRETGFIIVKAIVFFDEQCKDLKFLHVSFYREI